MNDALMIGLAVFGIILVTGIALSAWKGEFGKNQYYCTNCSNPSHWNPEVRVKEGLTNV